MARQGNYVTLPGGSGPNPFEGVSRSLADLSKMYTDRAALDREEALKRDQLAEEQRRWDIANKRQQTLADRETEAYNTKQAMTDWYKNFSDTYNPDVIRTQKAKDIYGVTDEQLKGDLGRKILDAVPLYQEDVANFYGKKFSRQFGQQIDPTVVQANYGNLNSLQALQEAENENAKRRFETAKFMVGKQIEAAGKLDPHGTAGTSSSKSTKIPKTYADISVADMVKDFDVNSGFNPFSSEKQDAAKVAQDTLDLLQKEGKYNAAQAQAITEFVLDRSRNEEGLQGINTDKRNIANLIEQAKQGMTDSYNYTGRTGGRAGNAAAKKYLEGALSTPLDPNAFNARDIKTIRQTAAQQAIDRLLGRSTTPKQKAVPRSVTAIQNKNWDLAKGKQPSVVPAESTVPADIPLPSPEEFKARKKANFFRNVPQNSNEMYNADSTKQLARDLLAMPPEFREGALRKIKTKYGSSGDARVQAISRHILEGGKNL